MYPFVIEGWGLASELQNHNNLLRWSKSLGDLYIVYFTAAAGNSIGLFYVGNGLVEGVDVGGIKYSGKYAEDPDTHNLVGVVTFSVPANASLITGLTAGPNPVQIPVPLNLPSNFGNGSVVRIETPTGPVNARFELASRLP